MRVRPMILALMVGKLVWALPAGGETWDGPKLKPVPRQEVFEFTRSPTFVRAKDAAGQPIRDRYEISFASKANCDVAVAIHDASDRLVRHIVYGVLGSNAPEPLKADSLDQTLIWDGKDDQGKYVPDAANCKARVSLGLAPTFDKLIGYHPKDTVFGGNVAGVAADEQGVYVLILSGHNQLRMFDHDGNYLRTLLPWPADKVGTKDVVIPMHEVENGRTVPKLSGFGGPSPFNEVEDYNALAVSAGKIGLFTAGGMLRIRRLLRLRTDGTTGGEAIDGAPFCAGRTGQGPGIKDYFGGTAHMTVSPDGKWVYISGQSSSGRAALGAVRPYAWNAIYRFAWSSTEVATASDSFLGEVSNDPKLCGAGNDNAHFDWPEGLACDAAGRLYVCDYNNNRLQVFSPDGKHLKTIAIDNPREISINPKTGEIYLLCFRMSKLATSAEGRYERMEGFMGRLGDQGVRLVRLGPPDFSSASAEPARVQVQKVFPQSREEGRWAGHSPVLAVDAWTRPAKVWITAARGQLRAYADLGDRFELAHDFEEDVVKAGVRPRMLGNYKCEKLDVDPVRNQLYCLRINQLMRCDPEGPGNWVEVDVANSGPEDIAFSADGRLYVRSLKYLARYDPDKSKPGRNPGSMVQDPSSEVPFDYGETEDNVASLSRFGPLVGVIKINAMPGANGFDNGFGVSVTGQIVSFMKNYQNYDLARNMAAHYNEMPPLTEDRYRPRVFPGRNFTFGELVMRWSEKGEPTGEDLIPALPPASCGIGLDRDGNIYCGIGSRMYVDGKQHRAGALGKFAPAGAKLYGRGDVTKLDKLPDRPPEFWTYGWGDLWTKGMFWAYPGYDMMYYLGNPYACLCSTSRFDLDYHARSFVPKAYQFCVGVVDANGNPICEIGRYGNADSPAMKPGGSDIGLAHCSYLATESDKWLYLNDSGNCRIIRVKLGYHAERVSVLQ